MTNDQFRHSFRIPFHNTLGLTVYSCGVERCAAGHSWGPAIRDHYLIHCITKGKGCFQTQGKDYSLNKGDGFVVCPDQIVFYEADRDDPWEYCWIGFHGTDAAQLMEQTGLLEDSPVFSFEGSTLPNRILEACNVPEDSSSSELRMQANLLLFLSDLIDRRGKSTARNTSGYEYVQKAIRYIEYNYSRNITIRDVAASAGISRSHLYRLFVENTSMPPNEYLLRYRINRAAALLETKRFSVGEVAYSTGFSDQLYFSRVFKKYIGTPPSRYQGEGRIRKEQ